MSDKTGTSFQSSIPALCLKTLSAARIDISMRYFMSDSYIFNRVGIEQDPDTDLRTLTIHKANRQIVNIYERVAAIKEMAFDFNARNFQKRIDERNKFRDFDDQEDNDFDPYHELSEITDKGYAFALPSNIATYKELLLVLEKTSEEYQANNTFYLSMLPPREAIYTVRDDFGQPKEIPETEVPIEILANLKSQQEVQSSLSNIEIEHCLDNYDEWFLSLTSMIQMRSPFSDILTLFK